MKKTIISFVITLSILSGCFCDGTILKKHNEVTVTGYGATIIEAKVSADKKAALILGKFTYIRDTKCVHEVELRLAFPLDRWACTVYAEKVDDNEIEK